MGKANGAPNRACSHDDAAEPQDAADQYERRSVGALIAERSIERAAGEHADQHRKQSPHDDALSRTGSSCGHFFSLQLVLAPAISRWRPRTLRSTFLAHALSPIVPNRGSCWPP